MLRRLLGWLGELPGKFVNFCAKHDIFISLLCAVGLMWLLNWHLTADRSPHLLYGRWLIVINLVAVIDCVLNAVANANVDEKRHVFERLLMLSLTGGVLGVGCCGCFCRDDDRGRSFVLSIFVLLFGLIHIALMEGFGMISIGFPLWG